MIIFLHHTGPMLEYKDGILHISDLNPEIQTKWRMSRMEMIKTGIGFIKAALKRRP